MLASQGWPADTNAFFFQLLNVLAGAKDGIGHNCLGINPVSCLVVFYRLEKIATFVKGVEADFLNEAVAAYHGGEYLGSEFDFRSCFAANDGPDAVYRDADDSVFCAMGLALVHLALLGIDLLDYL